MRICAIIPFYNDFTAGKRLYQHLHKHDIYSIWADGRFHNFKQINGSNSSTDELPGFLKLRYDVEVMDVGLCQMYEKLNRLFERAGSLCYDYCFLFGCDEYPDGDFEILLQNLEMFNVGEAAYYRVNVDVKNPLERFNKDNGLERIFYKPEKFTVHKAHWYYHIDGKVATSIEYIIKGVIIIHDEYVRTPERNQMMSDYQGINKELERDRIWEDIRQKIKYERKHAFSKKIL